MSRSRRVALAVVSGVLVGLSYPPVPTSPVSAVALVPVLMLFAAAGGYGTAIRSAYLWQLVVGGVALYWTGGFTHGRDAYLMAAGGALVLFHPLFMLPAVWALMFVKRRLGWNWALASFPFVWVTMEWLCSKGEFAFPWLTLGNTQTYDLASIQIASVTGVFGLSFWICVLNVLAFLFFGALNRARVERSYAPALILGALLAAVYLLPGIYGRSVLAAAGYSPGEGVRAGIVQPDIDPWEKWEEHGDEQLRVLLGLTRSVARRGVDLVIWPETATPFYLLSEANRPSYRLVKGCVDSLGAALLTGAPDMVTYAEGEPAPPSSKVSRTGRRYDTFNSILLLQPGSDSIQRYAKIILVPFAERVPYSDALSFLNAVKWNFGLGGWGIGRDTTLFRLRTRDGRDVRFASFVCYESVFSGYVSAFVRKGAQFLAVVTNDSWWGRTSGAVQHERYAIFRAVENRRWVVRCANGGVSCIIDPFGRILEETEMYTRTEFAAAIEPRSDLTFFSRHGDWAAEACMIVCLFLLGAAGGKGMYASIRTRGEESERTPEHERNADEDG